MKRANFPHRRAQRKAEAESRQEAFNSLPEAEKQSRRPARKRPSVTPA